MHDEVLPPSCVCDVGRYNHLWTLGGSTTFIGWYHWYRCRACGRVGHFLTDLEVFLYPIAGKVMDVEAQKWFFDLHIELVRIRREAEDRPVWYKAIFPESLLVFKLNKLNGIWEFPIERRVPFEIPAVHVPYGPLYIKRKDTEEEVMSPHWLLHFNFPNQPDFTRIYA
ncbi:MAG TPA: hypothetical protein VD967_01940 [Candidatus Paceibacterota bacterium]|nr:hypothetical protein [Candidatus Paceibacterota bacterium]